MNSSNISRREFSRQLVGGLGTALIAPAIASSAMAAQASQTPRRPNIIFVLSDQHSYKYCGFMGHPYIRTPNIDRLARQGTAFSSAYCGSPVCAPSRAGMLSGTYPSDVNSFCNSTVWDGSHPAWPAMLRDAGYRTFGCGWMNGNSKHDMGFEEEVAINNNHETHPDITAFFRRPLCSRIDERKVVEGRVGPGKNPRDTALAEAAIKFIEKQAQSDRPWAAYCGLYMPHPPFIALEEHYNYYLNRVDLPNVPPGHLEDLHFVFQQLRHFKNIATPIPEESMRRARAAYFATIEQVDGLLGRVWSALEASGQLDNTIIVYSSDHGESLGEHGLWLKNNLYDVAARIPLVMAGPGIPRGKIIGQPVGQVDLIRTFIEWGGAKPHAKMRGHSLLPVMRGENGDHPGWAYAENHTEGNCTGSFMIRKGDWKYVHFTWYDGLLFNLADDPGELVNRFADPAAQDVLRELQGILHAQVDPVEVTQRAFAVQRRKFDAFATELNQNQMMDQFRGRLGEGQAVALLTAYYGRTFPYEHKSATADAGL